MQRPRPQLTARGQEFTVISTHLKPPLLGSFGRQNPMVHHRSACDSVGVGISSGNIFLGNVGSRRRYDYTVIGADVNIAQRLASVAESGQTLITRNVKDGLNSGVIVTEESPRVLKGLKEAISVFSISQ